MHRDVFWQGGREDYVCALSVEGGTEGAYNFEIDVHRWTRLSWFYSLD